MKEKAKFNYEDIMEALNIISTFNQFSLGEVEIIYDGEPIKITQHEIDKWLLVGLNISEWLLSTDRDFDEEMSG